jgi:rare lipoprotein A
MTLRVRPRHAVAGALTSLATLSGAALTPAQAETPSAPAAIQAGGASAPPAAAVTRRPVRAQIARARLVVRQRPIDVLAGSRVRIAGTLLPRRGGQAVTLEARSSGRWHAIAHGRTRRNGHFGLLAQTGSTGRVTVRVRFSGNHIASATRAGIGTLTVYRVSLASWYSDYGGALACGGTLQPGTLGVANKSLPCGTKVTLRYGGRSVTVPVVDRGPYVGGREWDLTGATAARLGFDGVGTIWSSR